MEIFMKMMEIKGQNLELYIHYFLPPKQREVTMKTGDWTFCSCSELYITNSAFWTQQPTMLAVLVYRP